MAAEVADLWTEDDVVVLVMKSVAAEERPAGFDVLPYLMEPTLDDHFLCTAAVISVVVEVGVLAGSRESEGKSVLCVVVSMMLRLSVR